MNHHIYHVLNQWAPNKDMGQWILVTVIDTEGSSYRKVGAMMMFNDSGFQQGVISGGCLESDVLLQARRCWLNNQARVITYDMQEEGDVAWRLGIGCGGKITLLLQPVHKDNGYLGLEQVLSAMEAGQAVSYYQVAQNGDAIAGVNRDSVVGDTVMEHQLEPPKTLVVLGGGVDAQPVVQLAATLGWKSFVNDGRARYARSADFPHATATSDLATENYADLSILEQADAVILMHHQVGMDAQALKYIHDAQPQRLKYLALLGPGHRTQRVIDEAEIDANALPVVLHAPAGIDLGGDLPESIALSIIAQAHAILSGGDNQTLMGRF